MGNLLQKLKKEVSVIQVSENRVLIGVKLELTETQEVFFLIPRGVSYYFKKEARAGDQFSYVGIEFSANETDIRLWQTRGEIAGEIKIRRRMSLQMGQGKIKECLTSCETPLPATIIKINGITFSEVSSLNKVIIATQDSTITMTEYSPGIYTVGMF